MNDSVLRSSGRKVATLGRTLVAGAVLAGVLFMPGIALGIETMVIKYEGSSRNFTDDSPPPEPWKFCRDVDSPTDQFKAVASGFIDVDSSSPDPDAHLNWKVVLTNKDTGSPEVLVEAKDSSDATASA